MSFTLILTFLHNLRQEDTVTTRTLKFKIGQTVELNTGGSPVMSVKDFSVPRNTYICQWFAGKKLDQGEFKEEQLIAAVPKAPLPPPENEKK